MATKKVDRIVIRMYRIGTGDCFVLKFFSGEEATFSMMIDFGSCRGNTAEFTRFAKEIREYLNDQLDLLVVSHEHLDHIIGFSRGADEFKLIDIGHVWVAWTEDPTNKLARRLKAEYGKDVKSLEAAVAKMSSLIKDQSHLADLQPDFDGQATLEGRSAFLAGLTDSLRLYEAADNEELAATAGGSDSQKAMEFVLKDLKRVSGEPPFYCYPGKPVPKLKGLQGIQIYVLGPPENEEYLKKEEIKDDMYKRKFRLHVDAGFTAALTDSGDGSQATRPFAQSFRCSEQMKAQIRSQFLEGEQGWRNIDMDWLMNAGNLAIRLEKYVNNTSLVLAIELADSGKVLLWPGDAQLGSWRSWHETDLKWKAKQGRTTKIITARDLLERTVFYKVGHHLSHNGTASKSGLDMMDSDELVAFASLDYNNISPGWKKTMPAPGLLDELIRRTKGRVFRIDRNGLIDERRADQERNKMSSDEKRRFENAYEIEPSFIQFTIQ